MIGSLSHLYDESGKVRTKEGSEPYRANINSFDRNNDREYCFGYYTRDNLCKCRCYLAEYLQMRCDKGFSLIELLVVLVIIDCWAD